MKEYLINQAKNLLMKKLKPVISALCIKIIVIVMLAGAVMGVVGLVANIFLAIFDPFINAEQYQTEAVYTRIHNYGGAYKAMELANLTSSGADNEVIESVFKQEFTSYDTEVSTITVPSVSQSYYDEWLNNASKDTKNPSTVEAVWDMNSATYEYRTNWEYIMALAATSCFENEEEFEKAVEAVSDKMDADGKVTDSSGIYFDAVDTDLLDKVEASMRKCGLWTEIKYFTNYTSDYLKQKTEDKDQGNLYCGDTSQTQITSGYSFVNYNYALFKTNITRKDEFNEDGVATSMRYSTLGYFNGKYDMGNNPGEYAYITKDGYLYPVLLVKEASNWLCRYYDFDYVKIKDGSNTHYVVTTYKKEYRIADIIKQWDDLGVSDMYELIMLFLQQCQDTIGGSAASELNTAYKYYKEYGKELVISYSNPAYAPFEIEGAVEIGNVYAPEVTAKQTDSDQLTKALAQYYKGGDFKPDKALGSMVAQVFYMYNLCYQPAVDGESNRNEGYRCLVYNETSYNPDKGWGNKAYDEGDAGTEGSGYNDRVGLCSAGFINYILRYSLFGMDYGTQDDSTECLKYLKNRPSITDLYWNSEFKFQNENELRPGDLAFLNTNDNSDYTNICAYYVGVSDGNHIFYALNPSGVFNSNGTVRKICLSSDPGDVDITQTNLKYFCRYYRGGYNELPYQYTAYEGVDKQLWTQFDAINGSYWGIYLQENPTHNHIDYLDNFVDAMYENPAHYGCTNYHDKEVLAHIASGIMPHGMGDSGSCGFEVDPGGENLYNNTLLHFPVPDYKKITSWYSWRVLHENDPLNWHKGIDISASAGTEVYASARGVIITAESGHPWEVQSDFESTKGLGYGNYIVIDHGGGVTTLYGHLKDVKVEVGQEVSQDTLIGTVGSSGHSSGYHLHYEVTDGVEHTGHSGMNPGTDRGERPEEDKDTVDPYQFFPYLAGSDNVGSDIYYDRPLWFEQDEAINKKKEWWH